MMDYLFELGVEELPATQVDDLLRQFHQGWQKVLQSQRIEYKKISSYATPRRLALLTSGLADNQSDLAQQKSGPWLEQAYDDNDQPSKAALGFAKSCGVCIDQLDVIEEKGKQRLSYIEKQKGKQTRELIPSCIEQAIKQLHLAKSMRWGSNRFSFVRPVRWICSIANDKHLPVNIFGIDSSARSNGHRFLHPQSILIDRASSYLSCLEKAHVIADQKQRKQSIVDGVSAIADELQLNACYSDALINELTYLVEKPYPLVCSFERDFLALPDQLLKATMVKHQRYIYFTNEKGNIEPSFITISNISDTHGYIALGNQRVLKPRLSDASFFLEQDRKLGIQAMADKLDTVVFEASLGDMSQRTKRIQHVVKELALQTHTDQKNAVLAASLCKADLVSLMVGEFPELQGIMGAEYAAASKQPETVCRAIAEHYLPRFAGDELPQELLGQILSIADRLDVITGFFLIGKKPTSDKDPYGLRRAALGVIRIASALPQLASLPNLVALSSQAFQGKDTPDNLLPFFLERMRFWYIEQGITAQTFSAVAASSYSSLYDFQERIKALNKMQGQQTIASLGALSKRIGNIIAATENKKESFVKPSLLQEAAEKDLFAKLEELQPCLRQSAGDQDYPSYLEALISFEKPVNKFFDQVMVNSDNQDLKNNRLSLLSQVHELCTKVADISHLDIKS